MTNVTQSEDFLTSMRKTLELNRSYFTSLIQSAKSKGEKPSEMVENMWLLNHKELGKVNDKLQELYRIKDLANPLNEVA